jgi:hypothetical protein
MLSTTTNFMAGRTGPLCEAGAVCCGALGGALVWGAALGVCWDRAALEQSRSRARLGSDFFIGLFRVVGMNQSCAFAYLRDD